MSRHTTDELLQILGSLEGTRDLADYTASAADADTGITFPIWIEEQMKKTGISAGELIRQAQIQRNYGYQILNGSRHPGRDKVICLCLAMRLPLEEAQRALTISEETVLYPRRRRDSILIFGIEHQLTVEEVNQLLFEMHEPTLD